MSCVPVLHQSMRTIIPVDGVADSANPSGETGSAPDAVTDLAAGTPSATSVTLTWTLPEGATATVYRRDVTAAGSYTEIADEIAVGSYNATSLTPENEYQFKITLTNEYGTSADSNVVSVTTAEAPEGLIWSEDFEGALQIGTTLSHGASVVTSGAMSGTKCGRVNLKDGVTDGISGNAGDNRQTIEYLGTHLRDENPIVRTIMWDFKFDDAWWKGSNFSNASSSSIAINLKGGYFGPYPEPAPTGFFPVFNGGANGSINIGSNHSADWINDPWVNDPGRQLWYLETGEPFGSDGLIHTFKITIDSSNVDYHAVRMWIDDELAVNGSYATDGIIRLPKTWEPECFTTCYTNEDIVNTSEDRTGIACGMYIDNIRIYAGEEPA